MKAIIKLYRRFYAMPHDTPDRAVMSRLIILFVFFFVLGFTVSQVIIFLIEK